MKIHEGSGDELESTARLPVLDEPAEHVDPGDTGTWSSGEGPFAQFGPAQRGALPAEIATRDARAEQLQARVDEAEAWAGQLSLELERLRAVLGANAQAEARLAEAQTQRAHWEAAAGEAWAQLAESETAAGELRPRLAEAETAASELRTLLAEAETAAGEVRAQLAEAQAATGEARSQLAEAQAATSEARSLLALSQAAVGAIRAELQRAVDERDAVRAQLSCDHAELERLRAAAKRSDAADAAAPGARGAKGGSAAALQREVRSQQLRIDTLLEQLRSQEALRRFSGDLRRAGSEAGAEPAQAGALRRQVAELEARIAEADAAAAAALDRARSAEGARTQAEESARSRQQELEARIAVLEGSVGASARELETLRQRELELADELAAARRPQPVAAMAAPAPTVEPGAAADGHRAPAQHLPELTAELERRDHRIQALQVENAAQAEALRAIRRGLGLLGGERLPAPGGPEVAPRWLTRLDDGSNRRHVLRSARCSVGRTPHNDVEVPESYVSRSHAVFRLGPDSTVVEDAGSANGVFVNDVRVRRQLLKDGDSVGFGKARYRFDTQQPGD